ncbi:MAG: hypothetical protein QF436_04000 [Candidatus Woesearchaeota archaeon]|jgi:hypothetical protein|nr:hypothetical protein [Candidatus Woesearchaeota archaeon]MDP7623248.1 hypothetical protein [Candidatus Woesearchaeota archaeon]HJN56672.1 hypothetical protein [Candidatus Woesearchaeota archaeon]|tara:strand:+ start:1461 stop:2360 length:900 start_codon:yes stop_codon:yes gene_type:complete
MKKYILPLIIALSGCSLREQLIESETEANFRKQANIIASQQAQKPSYKLEDLLDTEIKERDLTLHVYIQPSQTLWDYHDYRNELFGYVKSFFAQNKINCNIIYSDTRKDYNSHNELGVEVLDSGDEIVNRYFELFSQQNKFEGSITANRLKISKGYAVTQKGIALVNGGWEEFREDTSRKDKKYYYENDGVMLNKENILRQNAGIIVHEVLHCMSLFHPNDFYPALVSTKQENIPNVLSHLNPEFSDELPLGYGIADLQLRLMHSFLAGNNTYKAFVHAIRILDVFEIMIAKENNLFIR